MSVSQVESLRRLLQGVIAEIKSVRDDFTDKYNTLSSILTSLESLQPEFDSDSGEAKRDSESDAESSSVSSASPSGSDSDADAQGDLVLVVTAAATAPAQSSSLVAAPTSGLARKPSAIPQPLRREPAFILDVNGNNILDRSPSDPESALYGITGALARSANSARAPSHPVPTQGFPGNARSSAEPQHRNNASYLAYLAASATMDRVLASRQNAAGTTSDGDHARASGSGVASEPFQPDANAPRTETTQNPAHGNALVVPRDGPDAPATLGGRGDSPGSDMATPARVTRAVKRKRAEREESGALDEEEGRRSAKRRSSSS